MLSRNPFQSLAPIIKGQVIINKDFPPIPGEPPTKGPVWKRLGGFLLDVLQGFASTYRPRQSLDINITGEPGVLRRGVPPDMRGFEGPVLGQVPLPQNTQRWLFGVGEAFRRHFDSQPLGAGLGPRATGNILRGLGEGQGRPVESVNPVTAPFQGEHSVYGDAGQGVFEESIPRYGAQAPKNYQHRYGQGMGQGTGVLNGYVAYQGAAPVAYPQPMDSNGNYPDETIIERYNRRMARWIPVAEMIRKEKEQFAPPDVQEVGKQVKRELALYERTRLRALFGRDIFSVGNKAVTEERNLVRLRLIANWIVKQRMSQQLTDIDPKKLTKEQKHLFDVANKLHLLLNANESLGEKRDDARTFANGLKIIIDANTGPKDQMNTQRLLRDLQYFTIDQQLDLVGRVAKHLHGYGPNNAAHNLMGGPRLGAVGWSKRYWNQGQLYERDRQGNIAYRDGQPVPINQAHHFTGFFILGYQGVSYAQIEAFILDGISGETTYNEQDLDLSKISIKLGKQVKTGEVSWKDLPSFILYQLRN